MGDPGDIEISKIEDDVFCFTGLDIKVEEDSIRILIEDYTQSLKDIKDIMKVEDQNEELSNYPRCTEKILEILYSLQIALNQIFAILSYICPRRTKEPPSLIFIDF